MHTTYVDVVYLHDIEFIAEQEVKDSSLSIHDQEDLVLNTTKHDDHSNHPIQSLGKGDEIILEAIQTLFQLKQTGQIKKVGISGYPLPTLLRISTLIHERLHVPLDIIMSYSHYTLQNQSLRSYAPLFHHQGIPQVINASPFSMGLLTTQGPQDWHPAPMELKKLCNRIGRMCDEKYQIRFEKVALRFGIGCFDHQQEGVKNSVVVGFSGVEEVEECVEIWMEGLEMDGNQIKLQDSIENEIQGMFKESGYLNWSWPTTFLN